MTLAAPQSRYTPDDVLRLEKEGLYELVNGRLVEKEMSSLANETAGLIAAALVMSVRNAKSGDAVYPEQTFQCFAHDPDLIRRPDIAVIVSGRRSSVPRRGHVPVAPDLAVEVISPNDTMYEFEEKLVDYRKARVPLVWEVNPEFRFVRVHYLDGRSERLKESDTLTGDTVLPGFSVTVPAGREALTQGQGI
jgi:Uma2 family endonuclease